MAFSVVCRLGHPYISADIYEDWPADMPHCPVCFEEWKFQKRLREYGNKPFPYSNSGSIVSPILQQEERMTLYDWSLKHGAPVDYWKNVVSGVADAWCPHDMEAAEKYSIEGLLDSPPEIEEWVNGIVIPFGVLLELREIRLPEELEKIDLSKMVEKVRRMRFGEKLE